MNKYQNQKISRNQEAGSVLVELAFILPIIFVISLTSFEFTRAIHRLSIASSASKEFANIAKRGCTDGQMANCLANFQTYLQSIVPGIELAVTEIQPNGTPAAPNTKATWRVKQSAGSLGRSNINRLMDGDKLQDGFAAMDRNESIIFAECFVPYSPVITFVNSIFNLPFVNGSYLYDATII